MYPHDWPAHNWLEDYRIVLSLFFTSLRVGAYIRADDAAADYPLLVITIERAAQAGSVSVNGLSLDRSLGIATGRGTLHLGMSSVEPTDADGESRLVLPVPPGYIWACCQRERTL